MSNASIAVGKVPSTEQPLVTLCVPTVGRLEYVSQVLRSVVAQTYEPTEILILDNASPPEAQEIFRDFTRRHVNARILRVESRVPMFANFNRGIRAAAGKYVAFFHDDDVYEATFVERYVTLLEANPGAVFAGGNFGVIDSAGHVTRQHSRVPQTGYWPGKKFIEDLIGRGFCALPTPGLVFRRELLSPQGFDESLPINWGDFSILMRLAERGDVAVSKDVQFFWRLHGENGSNIPFAAAIPQRTQILRDYLAEYRARHPHDTKFADRLTPQVDRGHRFGLLWGWLTASSAVDADSCLKLLRNGGSDHLLGWTLQMADTVGLSLGLRRKLAFGVRDLIRRGKRAADGPRE